MLTIEAKEVEQPPERERAIDPRRYYLPTMLGWETEQLRRLQEQHVLPSPHSRTRTDEAPTQQGRTRPDARPTSASRGSDRLQVRAT